MQGRTQQFDYHKRQPLRRSWRALGRALPGIDQWLQRPLIKPFALSFIMGILVISGITYAVSPWFELIVNRSDSLPGFLYLLDKNRSPSCGDTTVFDMPTDARFYRGFRLIKIIKGCPGDKISIARKEVFINGHLVGTAMPRTSNGKHLLYQIAEGVIPDHKVYLAATHSKSYDSRYSSFGLRDQQELLGSAYRLF